MKRHRLIQQSRVVLVVDTPNITKSIIGKHGVPVRPDYRWLIKYARSVGLVTAAVALVNDGVNPNFSNSLRAMGYQVEPSHAFDCDDAVVAWAVRLHTQADCVMICSGDHGFCELVCLLKAANRRIVLCAVDGSCNHRLRSLSDKYVEVPCYLLEKRSGRTRTGRPMGGNVASETKSTVLPVLSGCGPTLTAVDKQMTAR